MRDNMLINRKINFLKISALAFLSLNKFDAMENNVEQEEINDNYVNENYCLVDEFGNKITLDNDEDIKFKLYKCETKNIPGEFPGDVLNLKEGKNKKTLIRINTDKENKNEYFTPIVYYEKTVAVSNNLQLVIFRLSEDQRKNYTEENTIMCYFAKKTKEETINNNFILADSGNNEMKTIKGKNYKFKLLTRKKYLDLKEKLKDPNNYLKNDEEKYILDESQNPLFFEEEEENNNLILYVKRSKDNLCLAGLDLKIPENTVNKDNSIEVRMVKKEEIPMVKEKKEEIDKINKKGENPVDDDSSECCCGIC